MQIAGEKETKRSITRTRGEQQRGEITERNTLSNSFLFLSSLRFIIVFHFIKVILLFGLRSSVSGSVPVAPTAQTLRAFGFIELKTAHTLRFGYFWKTHSSAVNHRAAAAHAVLPGEQCNIPRHLSVHFVPLFLRLRSRFLAFLRRAERRKKNISFEETPNIWSLSHLLIDKQMVRVNPPRSDAAECSNLSGGPVALGKS